MGVAAEGSVISFSETNVTEISGDGCTTQKHVLLSNTLAFILDRQAT